MNSRTDPVVLELQSLLRDCTHEQIDEALTVVPLRHTTILGPVPVSITSIDRLDALLTTASEQVRDFRNKSLEIARTLVIERQELREVQARLKLLERPEVLRLAEELRKLADAIAEAPPKFEDSDY